LQREDVIARRQAKTLNLLPDELDTDPRLHKLWASLGEDYFQQYQATEIARHTEILLANHELAGPLVYLRHSPSRGSTEILIYTPDDNALFALITTVLEKLQLNVLSASINTTADGYALDTFNVLDSDGSLIKDSYRIDNIQSVLQRELQDAKDLPSLGEQRASRRLSHFSVDTEVHFENLENELVSVRIIAADRPGILSSIGRILQSAEVAVHAARITTLGERIDDVFFVRNRDGSPYHDSQARESLTQQLIEHL